MRGIVGSSAVLLFAATIWASAPHHASGQDIEAAAVARGLRVPAGYFERVQADPTAFTLPNGLFRDTEAGRVPSRAPVGSARIPVVLALFADSPEPHITPSEIQASLFDGPAPRGTVTEAYLEMSRGAFRFDGDVFPWVRTSADRDASLGDGSGLGADADLGDFFIEALAQVDPGVDFGLYDSDGPDGLPNSGDDDGYVDAMTFEFLEVAASCGGPGIWPHRWAIAAWNGGLPFTTDDRAAGDSTFIQVNGYITQSVSDCTGQNVQSSEVTAHELGHVLGLPDYYHPTGGLGAVNRRWVLGCWSLMAAGAWGCGPVAERQQFGPTHMDVRSKAVLGWADYTEVPPVPAENLEFVLDPIQQSGQGLRIQMDAQGRQFLLVEYRTQDGFDADLPGEGVLIYHQDFDGDLRPDPDSTDPYFLALLEYDDNRGLVRTTPEGGNRGEAGDAWGIRPEPDVLDATTSPNTLLNDGRASPVTFHSISVEGGQAHIVLSIRIELSEERVLQQLLQPSSEALTELEREHFDVNENGRFDVGDFRAWTRSQSPG